MALSLRGVGVAFDGKPFIDNLSLDLPDGSITALLGPSGSGKSTLLRAIAGLEAATGQIAWDGRELIGVPTHRRGFALMFQDGQLFDHLSVARNVAYGLSARSRTLNLGSGTATSPPGSTPEGSRARPGRSGRSRRQQRVEELLDLVGLHGYGGRNPATLSGGERQRVALARALAVDPKLLLLDEPLSSLDASLRERLAVDLREILRAAGTTALLVTHDQEEAFTIADRIALMRDGSLVQTGSLEHVWAHPTDAEAALFLGYARVLDEREAEVLLTPSGGRTDGPDTRLDAPSPGLNAPDAYLNVARSGLDVPDRGFNVPGSALAVRRSALILDEDGTIEATVIESRATPEQIRLVVEIDGLGRIDAVAPLGAYTPSVTRRRLRLDRSKTAVLTPSRGTP